MKNSLYSVNRITFYDGVKSCLPTILGYIGIGIAAGVVGNNAGLSTLEIALMSILIYAGSAQFIICSLLMLNSSISTIIVTTFLVNLRHFLMSLSVSQYFKKYSILSSIGIGALLTDESYGVLMAEIQNEKKVSLNWTNGLNITAYFTWIFSTILGSLIGSFIPDPGKFGLDYALTSMFVGLFVLQIEYPIKTKRNKTLAILLSVFVSLYLFMRIFSPEVSVLFSTLLGCFIGVILSEHK